MTTEGRAFTDAYYGRYLDDFGVVFADQGVYGVTRDEDAFEQIARVIDQRYAEWVYAGRPELPPEDEPSEQLAAMLDDADLPPELTEEAVRSMSPDEIVAALERCSATRDDDDSASWAVRRGRVFPLLLVSRPSMACAPTPDLTPSPTRDRQLSRPRPTTPRADARAEPISDSLGPRRPKPRSVG